MSRYRQLSNENDYETVRVRRNGKGIENKPPKQNKTKQQQEPVTCGCFETFDSELKDSHSDNKMERSRTKVRSPRMKVSNVNYAPEGRRGNVYIDGDGRKIYRTSGKSGHSKRYVVMDDGELTRGEHQENSKIIYRDEPEYETVSEADSEYLVPVRPKGERRSTRRIVEGKPRIVARRTVSEEGPRVVTGAVATRGVVEEEIPRGSYVVRSESVRSRARPSSAYVDRRELDNTLDSRKPYVMRSRPASEIVRVRSNERAIVKNDAHNSRDVYVMRERPASAERIVSNKERILLTRPRSEERLLRREYIDYPQDYIGRRPPTRDVGCQMTTNYVIQQPPKQKKLLRNVQTQTFKKQKERKIKTTTYQRETVEVVHEPAPTPRIPTPPPRIPTPPPRLPTPEPPKPKKKKSRKDKKNMQLVVKQPNYPEPVYDRIEEDLEVVPGSSKIYYEEPKKVPNYQNSEPDTPTYAYYEPSEYPTKKSEQEKATVPLTLNRKVPSKVTLKVLDYFKTKDPDKFYIKLDITAESCTSSSSSSSSDSEKVQRDSKFYTIPLKGSTTFHGPHTYPPNRKVKQKRKRKQKLKLTYEQPRYVATPKRERRKQKVIVRSHSKTSKDSVPPMDIEPYLRKVPPSPPVHITDYMTPTKHYRNHKKEGLRPERKEYAAKLPRGPSFLMTNINSKHSKNKQAYHPSLMYLNPETEKVEPLKYTVEKQSVISSSKTENDGEEPRYVTIPDITKSSVTTVVNNTDKYPDNGPLVLVTGGDREEIYIDPVASYGSDKAVKNKKEEYPVKVKAKGKSHMVRVGGGWMKVEHHRNHHTPLKIYEIPREANDDKFLYIKSRFNTSKKDVPIAYKKYREEIVRG